MGFLTVWTSGGTEFARLSGDRLLVGRSPSSDLVVAADPRASRLHAAFERLGDHWCLRDLTSRNGTFLNGTLLAGQARLTSGDEVRIGSTRIMVQLDAADEESSTEAPQQPPRLTPRERDVLVALIEPIVLGGLFAEPAAPRAVATRLHVTEAAVRQHLINLYDKFGLIGQAERRRSHLANEAVRRGAVRLAEIRSAG